MWLKSEWTVPMSAVSCPQIGHSSCKVASIGP
jgi:hypothetical protein